MQILLQTIYLKEKYLIVLFFTVSFEKIYQFDYPKFYKSLNSLDL